MYRQLRDAPPSLEEGLDCLICYSGTSQSTEIALTFSATTELEFI